VSVTLERPDRIADPAELAEVLREYLEAEVAAPVPAGGYAIDTAGMLAATMTNLGAYLPPRGMTILARGLDGGLLGTVFLKFHGASTAEIKRLYVRPSARGTGLGRRLATEAIGQARAAGAQRVLIDTMRWMRAAQDLYRGLGFRTVPPYPESENDPAVFDRLVFMELRL